MTGKPTRYKEGSATSQLDYHPLFIPLAIGRGICCGCTTCGGCGELATWVAKYGLCVCEDCLHCPAAVAGATQSRLDDNLRSVFG